MAVVKQRLAGALPAERGPDHLLDVARSIRAIQLDPISVVARSHQLVLFSRIGPYDVGDLDVLLWEDRSLFEYWAHAASLVLTQDYPIHQLLMRRYPTDRYAHGRRTREWVEQNRGLRRRILQRIRAEGPLRARDLDDDSRVGWVSGGWTSGRNVERMIDYLWTKGVLMVVGRPGGLKLWDLAERWLPAWTPRDRLPEARVHRLAAEHALRALGMATPRHINEHFTRWRYRQLPAVLAGLERRRRIHPLRVAGDGSEWPGPWFVHDDDLPLLERLERGDGWEPRTALLSPFDNLICDRARTRRLFGFDYAIEIYTPKSKRRFGYYAMPVLRGDELIGRIDPAMDRKSGRLTILSMHAEPNVPQDRATGTAISGAIQALATFLGARDVAVERVDAGAWRRAIGGA
jgi:uncharacterized protein YcaQ